MEPSNRRQPPAGELVTHLLAGLAGGLVGAFVMERFQYALASLSPDVGGAPGGGGQQYRKPQSEPATYKAAEEIARATAGRCIPGPYKPAAGSVVHYAFGGAAGAIYGVATALKPDVAAGKGLAFGVAVWLAADEIGVPLAGLSKPPTAYPLKDHASALAAHLVYGATTECVRSVMVRTTSGSRATSCG